MSVKNMSVKNMSVKNMSVKNMSVKNMSQIIFTKVVDLALLLYLDRRYFLCRRGTSPRNLIERNQEKT